MQAIKALFVKPDPQEQLRKCNAMMRSNQRKLDRDINVIKQVENKARKLIIQADNRAQRDPSRAKQAHAEARGFAKELLRARRANQRLVTSKAQLNSVQLQVNEAFAMRKIEGSIRASVGVMRDVRSLVRLPEMSATMRELSVELMKAGIIDEMMDESLPQEDGLYEDEEDEAEAVIDKVLGEVLKDRTAATATPAEKSKLPQGIPAQAEPARPTPALATATQELEDEEDEDPEVMMNEMRSRLEALRS